MRNKLIALKLILDELNIPFQINSVEDRKRIQKSIYLSQLRNIDLGYRYGWYLMGPYCRSLAKDYYELDDSLTEEIDGFSSYCLKTSVCNELNDIKNLFHPPEGINIKMDDWLELLASVHYLYKVRNDDDEVASKTLEQEKSHLVHYLEQAKSVLTESKLI